MNNPATLTIEMIDNIEERLVPRMSGLSQPRIKALCHYARIGLSVKSPPSKPRLVDRLAGGGKAIEEIEK